MSATTVSTARTATGSLRHRAAVGSAVAAAVLAAVGVVDLVLQPTYVDNKLHTSADYVFTVLSFPFALSVLAAVALLHQLNAGRDGRLGRAGFLLLAGGLLGIVVAAVASLVWADDRALSPLYPLATLATFVGWVLFAVGSVRARALPAWTIPLLAVTWVLGGPIAPFAWGFFLSAGAFLAVGWAVRRPR